MFGFAFMIVTLYIPTGAAEKTADPAPGPIPNTSHHRQESVRLVPGERRGPRGSQSDLQRVLRADEELGEI